MVPWMDSTGVVVAASHSSGGRSPALGATAAKRSRTAAAAAATAAVQGLAAVDGRPVSVHGGTLEIELPLGLPVAHRWAPHPRCACGAQLPDGRPEPEPGVGAR